MSQLFHSIPEAELLEGNPIQKSWELNQFNPPKFRGVPQGVLSLLELLAYLASKLPFRVEINTLKEVLSKNSSIFKSEELDKYDLAEDLVLFQLVYQRPFWH